MSFRFVRPTSAARSRGAVPLVVVGAACLTLVTSAGAASASPKDASGTHRTYVCKYVGKPGVAERLKGGQQPIAVDRASITAGWFADGQTMSYALGPVVASGPVPSAASCPTRGSGGDTDPGDVGGLPGGGTGGGTLPPCPVASPEPPGSDPGLPSGDPQAPCLPGDGGAQG